MLFLQLLFCLQVFRGEEEKKGGEQAATVLLLSRLVTSRMARKHVELSAQWLEGRRETGLLECYVVGR